MTTVVRVVNTVLQCIVGVEKMMKVSCFAKRFQTYQQHPRQNNMPTVVKVVKKVHKFILLVLKSWQRLFG